VKTIYGIFILSRPINLALVVFTMYSLKTWLFDKALSYCDLPQIEASFFNFWLLAVILVLLTASGNIINDYFDVRVDKVNRPESVIIDKMVKRRVAIIVHFFLNGLAVGLAAWLAFRTGIILLLVIPVLLTVSVWFYSSTWKKHFLTGNLLVATMVSTVPLLTGILLYYPVLLFQPNTLLCVAGDSLAVEWSITAMLIYTVFAFHLTLIREIQKDLEDVPGDSSAGFKTLAIVLGEKKTKRLIAVLLCLALLVLLWFGMVYFRWQIETLTGLLVFVLLILAPLLISLYFTLVSKSISSYTKAQTFCKVAMGGALLFLYFVRP